MRDVRPSSQVVVVANSKHKKDVRLHLSWVDGIDSTKSNNQRKSKSRFESGYWLPCSGNLNKRDKWGSRKPRIFSLSSLSSVQVLLLVVTPPRCLYIYIVPGPG